MPRQSDARQKMIESAALLFRERGVDGTSFTDVIEHSGAPRGSIYHHFADGKTQLAEEATRWAGEMILAGAVAALADRDPVQAIATFRNQWIKTLRNSDFSAGCVIVAATLEGEREPTVRDAAGQVFASWQQLLTDALTDRGVARPRALSIATLVIASVEGAIILSRAQRTVGPLTAVAEELQAVIADALPDRSPVT